MAEENVNDVIWSSTVDDGAYLVTVTRIAEYQATLTVVRTKDEVTILEEQVGLSYQAMFGPDIDDLRLWQEMAIKAIDKDLA